MTPGAASVSDLPIASILRDLRRDRFCQPANAPFAELVRRFLPLVYGVSLALIPENTESAEKVSAAVFETLAFRWKRIPRKTPLASWLVRTTGYAVAKERSRLGLKARSQLSNGELAQALFKKLNSLSQRRADAFVLCAILGEQPSEVAAQVRTSAAKVEKNYHKAVAKITKHVHKRLAKLQKTEAIEAPAFRSYVIAPPVEAEERIVARVSQWTRKSRKEPLVLSAISSWQWLNLGRFFKRLAATIGTVVLVLVLFGVTTAFLVKTGHVNLFLSFMDSTHKDLLKEFPGLAKPARPWPTKAEEMRLASRTGPKSAAELYGMTNIWLAKLKVPPEQWKAMQPVKVPPAPQLPNGKMALRNPKASRSGLAGAIGLDFPWVEGSFEFGEFRFPRVGVRYRGNGTYLNSRYGNKQSYKVDVNRFSKSQRLAGLTTLNFVNSIPDFSYVKDALAQQLFRELGAICPRTSYAYLTVDAPGALTNLPLGLYVMIEDVGGVFAKDRFGDKDVPIFKPVTYDLFDTRSEDWKNFKEIYDVKTKATKAQWARVEEFAKIVTEADDDEFARRLPEFLDLEEYAAFVAGHVLLSSY
ncbi:MAG TPA: CotH kinase family protein, partial [Verrucomicrobiae bacterium]|nr:CotH kinase family protein [Verrucomicrobiae bacterium]